ncbi:MAG: hypothetical protein D3923_20125, partial [Candidatus Electrothrix sp. AR3]|nr:hypothetical protein [Candidatus Electrothrix sp. AR3]
CVWVCLVVGGYGIISDTLSASESHNFAMNIYKTHNVHFCIALVIIMTLYLVGTYLIISKYDPLITESETGQARIESFVNEFKSINDNKILDTLILKYGNSFRDIIKEENEMIDHRMVWMLTLNGLLFTTLGFAWGRSVVLNWFSWILSGVGAMSALSFGFVLQTGVRSIECNNELWNVISKFSKYPAPLIRGFGKCDIISGSELLLPWICLPLLLYSAWLTVALAIAVEKREEAEQQHVRGMG